MTEPKVRIFVSSPSDVEHERALVKDIIATLAQEYQPYFKLEAVLWEEEALTAAQSFQAGILRPSECEIVLVMLWTRLGTPLADDPYGGMTGTEWEFVDAVEASARKGNPEVLVYQKTAPHLVDITNLEATREAVTERDRLAAFFRAHFFNADGSFRRAFRQFGNDAVFRELVETQLRKLLNRRISVERRFAAGAADWRGSPFRVLAPFGIGDERVFTGRETETRELVARLDGLTGPGAGLLLLTGASGVGKSSLIRAGLLPHLLRPVLFSTVTVCRWCLVEIDGRDPSDALAQALTTPSLLGVPLAEFGLDTGRLARLLVTEPAVAAEQVRAALLQVAHEDQTPTGGREIRPQLALILDPLDDLFAGTRFEEPSTQSFAAALAALAVHEGIWVVATLRSDHLPRLPLLPTLTALLDERSWFRLEPPGLARIRQVMEIPARVAGIEYEETGRGAGPGLVDALEAEASGLTHWTASLEQTLEELYQRAEPGSGANGLPHGRRLTLDGYRRVGGLAGALLRRADALWRGLDEDSRAALPTLCRALLSLEGGSRARVSPREADLPTLMADPPAAALVRALIEARLLVAEGILDPANRLVCTQAIPRLRDYLRHILIQVRDEWRARLRIKGAGAALEALLQMSAGGTPDESEPGADWRDYRPIVSFTHPVLFERWEPVRQWLADPVNRRDLTLRYQISRQARLWKRTDCNREYLLGEAGHAAARIFARAHERELEPLERDYLDQSQAQLMFQRRRNRWALGSALTTLLLLAGLALFSVWDASRQATLNLQLSLLREADVAIGRGNTPKAVRLALDAGADLPAAAIDRLSRALTANRLLTLVQPEERGAGRSIAPAFRDDGEQVVTLTTLGGARLWMRQERRGFEMESALTGPDRPLDRVRIVGGGTDRLILGIGPDGVWRLPTQPDQGPDWTCGGAADAPIALDSQGRYLARAYEASPDQFAVCLLDLQRPGAPLWDRVLHNEAVRSLAFAPDGRRLVTASRDGSARVVDGLTGAEQLVLPRSGPLNRSANRAVFDAEGRRIAVAAADEHIRIYGHDGEELAELGTMQRGTRTIRVHQTSVRDLAFSADGQSVVAGDSAGQVVRWDLRSRLAEVLGQHDLGIEQVAISPDLDPLQGEYLVLSVSLDRTARLWGLETGKPVAVFSHEAAISEARFSQDGRQVMTTARQDGSARLWSVAPTDELAARLDQSDHVWALAMAEVPVEPGVDSASVRPFLMATATVDGRIEVWRQDGQNDRAPPVRLHSFTGHQGRIRRLAFAPSVTRLASASVDGTARVWDLNSGKDCRLAVASQPKRCRSPGGADCPEVYQVQFAPDERWLLTTSSDSDQPVRLWDPAVCAALPLPDAFGEGQGRVQAATVGIAGDGAVLVATGNEGGTLNLIRQDLQGRWTRLCQLALHQDGIADVAIAPGGGWVATASKEGRAALFAVTASGCREPRYLDGHAGGLYTVQFAPDGEALVTAALEAKAHVWALDGTLLAELAGHDNRLSSAQFSPDGRWLLTASRDGTVRLWERPRRHHAEPQSAWLVLNAGLGSVSRAYFSPDGHRIGAAYWDNAALLWRIWTPDTARDRALETIWGKDRARLVLIHEAIRLERENWRMTAPALR